MVYDVIIITAILVGTWIASKALIKAVSRGITRSGYKSIPLARVRDGITLFAIILDAALIFDFTGVGGDLTGLSLTAILAIVASLALQGMLSDLISGLLLLHEGYLHEGDIVELGLIKGKLARLTLRTSYLETPEQNFVAISNQKMLQGPLINYSRRKELLDKVERVFLILPTKSRIPRYCNLRL